MVALSGLESRGELLDGEWDGGRVRFLKPIERMISGLTSGGIGPVSGTDEKRLVDRKG